MSKSITAALLSGLVFPGIGHFYLRKPIAGAVLACAAVASFYFVISKTVERALEITERIQSGEVPLDVATIAKLVSQQAEGNADQLLNVAWAVLIISWLIGIVDSYRCGRLQEKRDALAHVQAQSETNNG